MSVANNQPSTLSTLVKKASEAVYDTGAWLVLSVHSPATRQDEVPPSTDCNDIVKGTEMNSAQGSQDHDDDEHPLAIASNEATTEHAEVEREHTGPERHSDSEGEQTTRKEMTFLDEETVETERLGPKLSKQRIVKRTALPSEEGTDGIIDRRKQEERDFGTLHTIASAQSIETEPSSVSKRAWDRVSMSDHDVNEGARPFAPHARPLSETGRPVKYCDEDLDDSEESCSSQRRDERKVQEYPIPVLELEERSVRRKRIISAALAQAALEMSKRSSLSQRIQNEDDDMRSAASGSTVGDSFVGIPPRSTSTSLVLALPRQPPSEKQPQGKRHEQILSEDDERSGDLASEGTQNKSGTVNQRTTTGGDPDADDEFSDSSDVIAVRAGVRKKLTKRKRPSSEGPEMDESPRPAKRGMHRIHQASSFAVINGMVWGGRTLVNKRGRQYIRVRPVEDTDLKGVP